MSHTFRKHSKIDIVVAVLFTVVVSTGAYYAVRSYVLDRSERNVENLILSQRALHHYIQRVMHPTFFKAVADGDIRKTYYTPEIFSSSYIVRNMHGFYNEELKKHGRREIYYKMAADNPRNPLNKADAFEVELIEKFNKDRSLKDYRQIITLDGKKYLYYAIPFLENTAACLHCHGKREDAPLGLQARYLGEGGFNEKVGRIRAIESIRAPLHRDYEVLFVSFAVIGAAALSLLGLFLLSSRLRVEVERKTSQLEEELKVRTEAEDELRIQAAQLEEEIAERQKTQEELLVAKENAEAANKAKTQFLANMSHELRTPLNGVVGMAQLIAMSGVTEEQQEYLDSLQFSAGNLLALISDILDISRIEAGKYTINQAEYSLRQCIDEVIVTQKTAASAKSLSIQTSIPEKVPDLLVGDRLRVMQILSNLLSNAIKFTESGGIRFEATIKEQHGSTILLDFSLTDTGIGIEPDMLGHIFNMFTQVDESNTRRHGGAGLGLAISCKLAELMGGSITVTSKLGKGSTFHLLLPCSVPSQPNNANAETTTSVSILLSGQKRTVLIAEDNQANSNYAQKLMEKLGYQVTLAMDGVKALNAWEQGRFDLILMDVQMPGMNGDEVVRAIREREGATCHTPIIAVTAHALLGDQERLLEAGCDGYVTKPFFIETLAAEIKRVSSSC